ncbi:MAG: DUF4339 domain-containing protein [Verrucomicrobiales bacterium]|nr:DUF4339 domain-containing protein [Verrucomicrobiales bacterium]
MSTAPAEDNTGIEFSVMRRGSRDPEGPYSEHDLLELLNAGSVSAQDLIFYEGLGEWKAIGDVFDIQEQISHFIDDGQDTERVGQAFREVSDIVGSTENIFYIAVQAKASLLSKTKQCVVITEKHIYILHEKRVGYELEAHVWKTITNTLMRDEGKGFGTFSILLGGEKRIDVCHIPLKQVQRLFQLSQEMKEATE